MSSARWRSDNPPTVFDWLIRHWFRKRAALTRPNFGTAIRMSKTFAVETYSGGLRRTSSMFAEPDCVVHLVNTAGRQLTRNVGSDPAWRGRVGEQDRAQRDASGSGRDELEGVSSGGYSAHADDRQPGRRVAGVDGGQGDRLQRRSGEAAR